MGSRIDRLSPTKQWILKVAAVVVTMQVQIQRQEPVVQELL